jgi:NADPH2:quinone reductase
MRAATIVDKTIKVTEHPDPVPGVGQILVRVRAAGLNSADLMQVRGGYPAPPGVPPDIPGLELAGEVIARGPGAERFPIGSRVMAVVGGGGQAELAVMHEREAMPVPANVPWEAAGGFPEAFTTAHDALFTQCQLSSGERVCVHGAAGGVGVAGVQLAALAGAEVVATVRNVGHHEAVAALGATVIRPEETREHGPYAVILELVGAPNMDYNLRSLATEGRISVIGVGAGARAELELHVLMSKRGRIHGSTLRSRPPEGKAMAARGVETHVLPHLAAGRINVPCEATFPLKDAAAAYERFAAGSKFGKIVIVFD